MIPKIHIFICILLIYQDKIYRKYNCQEKGKKEKHCLDFNKQQKYGNGLYRLQIWPKVDGIPILGNLQRVYIKETTLKGLRRKR